MEDPMWRILITLHDKDMPTKTIGFLQHHSPRKNETLYKYIERFTKEAVKVRGANNKLKRFIF